MLNFSQIARQLTHLLYGLIILLFLTYFPEWGAVSLLIICVVSISLSFLERDVHIPLLKDLLDMMDHPYHRKAFPGKGFVFFNVGAFIAWCVFSTPVALASIAILTVGDTCNVIFGAYFGKRRHKMNIDKLVEGTVIGMLLSFLLASVYVSYIVALFGALAGMMVEVPRVRIRDFEIDDNLLMPVVSGVVMSLVA